MTKSRVFVICMVLFVLNAFLYTRLVKAGFLQQLVAPFLGEDFSIALRLLIFLVAAGFIWFLGRLTFQGLFRSEVTFGEALNLSYLLVLLTLLTVASLIFRGIFSWLLLPVLFVIAAIIGLSVLWRAVGGMKTLLVFSLTALMAATTYFVAV